MMWQKCNVILLPIKHSVDGCIAREEYETGFGPNYSYSIQGKTGRCGTFVDYHHIYIINPSEEIKVGDWCYDIAEDEVKLYQASLPEYDYLGYRKIIATTDESLTIPTYINQGDVVKGDLVVKRKSNTQTSLRGRISLPRPSDEFLKKYCGLGDIDEVLVEYIEEYDCFAETQRDRCFRGSCRCSKKLTLKTSIYNTIITKLIKDSWSREEVIELCRRAYSTGATRAFGMKFFDIQSHENSWIKENL